MHELMVGMFWGGVLMSLPPVAVGVAICVLLIRHDRATRATVEQQDRGGD
ncbi:MAG TPA: hypothetical protein VMM79_10515 [Longimicrobiales bacterium]|nr:hypothetical protein [Longimicrobiales bacterium]